VRRFTAREVAPFYERWEQAGVVPRELWLKAGAAGMLCCTVPEACGGAGADYLFTCCLRQWRGRRCTR
jgi:alkylation response protein AidB-like acyl-CoA dehydrogenase